MAAAFIGTPKRVVYSFANFRKVASGNSSARACTHGGASSGMSAGLPPGCGDFATEPVRRQRDHPSNASQPPLRLGYLAATTRALGHRITVVDGVALGFRQRWTHASRFSLRGLTIPELVARVPRDSDVVGVSMMFSQTWPPVRALLLALRAAVPRAVLVVGGEGVTGIADLVAREAPVDGVVVGEGEPPFTAVLDAAGAGRSLQGIPPVVTVGGDGTAPPPRRARPELRPLDDLPFPAWDALPVEEIAVSAFTPLPGSPHFQEMVRHQEVRFTDDFFATLAQGDLSLQVSVSPHFDGKEVQAMRLHALLWFYAHAFAARRQDLLALLGRVLAGRQRTKLDRVLRYEMLSLLRGFAPVLGRASFAVLGQVAAGYMGGGSSGRTAVS